MLNTIKEKTSEKKMVGKYSQKVSYTYFEEKKCIFSPSKEFLC